MLLSWVFKALRSFFWQGHADAKNGQCLVAWDVVCKPMAYCGLSFHNLKLMNTALRWCWLVSKQTEELFCTATECIVGNGYI
jgi:hypothetical protein